MFPASDVSAPLGMRIATGGMCSKESGMESKRTFIRTSPYCIALTPQALVNPAGDARGRNCTAVCGRKAVRVSSSVQLGMFLSALFRHSRSRHHTDHDSRRLSLGVIHALRGLYKIRRLGVRDVDEGPRVTIGERKP